MKRYCFDIDGTICNNTWGKYEEALPYKNRIECVNQLYNSGNYIIYFTARGMGTCNGDIDKAYEKLGEFTEIQLSLWGCKFHELKMGKPAYDLFIDDKNINCETYFK